MRRFKFILDEYYHIYNHGVEDREVFAEPFDFKRAMVSLISFNDHEGPPSNLSRFAENPSKLIEKYTPDKREKLVDIICFSLLPTHFHIFIREKTKDGISKFMHKFCKGYARYFNLKYDRSGALWQGTFKAKHINDQAYFTHIISYIHLNVLDLYGPEWREGEINKWSKVKTTLSSYPWSSYGYYRGKGNQNSLMDLILTQPEWLKEEYPEPREFERRLKDWAGRSLPENEHLGVT